MENYKYTNKLLKALAICNLWAFIPGIWSSWRGFELALAGVGDHTQIMRTLLFSSIQALMVLIFTTWAFLFRRWYWVVIFYVIYLSYEIPLDIIALIQFWRNGTNLYVLDSSLYSYTTILIWLLGIITIMVMLSETPYRKLFKRWHNLFQKIKTKKRNDINISIN